MSKSSDEAESYLSPADLGQLFSQHQGFMQFLGIELIDIGAGTASVRMRVLEQHLNFNNTCHGGVIFSLADCAFGISSNSHGIVAAGINAHINYQTAAYVGELLTATSREVSRSRKLATYAVEVKGEADKAIAAFTGTVYILGHPHEIKT